MAVDAKPLAGEGLPLATAAGGLPASAGSTAPASSRPSPDAGLMTASLRTLGDAMPRALATEVERGVPFLFAPVFMGLGATLYYTAAAEPDWATIAALFATAALGAWLARRNALAHITLVALLMAAAGALAAKFEVSRAGTTITGSPVATTVTGKVMRIEHRANGRVRLTLDVIATERPVLRFPPQRVRLTARAVPPGIAPGTTVTGYARLMPPSGPVRPDGYDFAFESYFDRIGAIGFYLGDPRLAAIPRTATRMEAMAAWLEATRLRIAERVRAEVGGNEGEIAATLIAGVRSGIPEPVNEALRRTGLAHILAISGLHMALVAATILVSIRSVAALFPNLVTRHPVKKYAAVAALLVCAFYLALSGAAVAAQRSFIMLAVMLVALLFDRAALTLRNLAIAALIILAVSPHEIMGPSFQMSFAATAALIAGYAMWNERRAARFAGDRDDQRSGIARVAASRLVRLAIGLAATSLIAGLATTVYGIYHFNRVSPLALAANMLAMPVVTFLVMPMAVVSTLLMPLGLDAVPLSVMGWGLRAVVGIAQWLSDRTTIDAVGTMPRGALLAFTLALIVATLSTTWLRVAALPLLLIAIVLQLDRRLPDILVSEDARLVAVRAADGRLALNRARPNGFTLQNWLHAQGAGDWLKPRDAADEKGNPDVTAFTCAEGTCIAHLPGGGTVVHAPDAEGAREHCSRASLIVLADATARGACPQGARVVTARDTARYGSLAVHLADAATGGIERNAGAPDAKAPERPTDRPVRQLRYAIAEPYRPWHEHRQYSREARGLAPYRPQRRQDD